MDVDLVNEELMQEINSCQLEENNTTYLDYIDATVDDGMVGIIDYFNKEVNAPTKFCCSGLIEDHYNIDELKQLDLSQTIPREYYFTTPPYVMFKPIYHRKEGETTVIDKEFHEFRNDLPEGFGVYITSDGFDTLEWYEGVTFQFEHSLLDSFDKEDLKYKYYYHLGTVSSLQMIFSNLNHNIDLYDQFIKETLDAFILMCKYPEEIVLHAQMRIDRDTEEIIWCIRGLDEIPGHLEEDDIVDKEKEYDGVNDSGYWTITATTDQLENVIKNDLEYIGPDEE